MCRELKFRAWDKEGKKYLLPEEQGFVILPTKPNFGATIPFKSEHYPNENLDIDCIDWADADLIMGRYILEQYTDLFDGNGEEICEGDVITFRTGLLKDGVPEISIGEVKFELGCFYVECKPLAAIGLNHCEIVGNIHEFSEETGGKDE